MTQQKIKPSLKEQIQISLCKKKKELKTKQSLAKFNKSIVVSAKTFDNIFTPSSPKLFSQ